MPQVIVRQATIIGADNDGSRSGSFVRGVTPGGCYTGLDFWLDKPIEVGYYFFPSTGCGFEVCSWLRFNIPFGEEVDVDLRAIRLGLTWMPQMSAAYATNERNANVNFDQGPLSVGVGVFDNGTTAGPIPTDAADAVTKIDAVTQFIKWQGDTLNLNPGKIAERLESDTFGFRGEDFLLESRSFHKTGWVKETPVTIFLRPADYDPKITRIARFWSWPVSKLSIAPPEEPDPPPYVAIDYIQNTPGWNIPIGSATFREHVEHRVLIQHGIDYTTNRHGLEHTLTITQDIEVAQEYPRTVESLVEITQSIQVPQTRSFIVEHLLTILNDEVSYVFGTPDPLRQHVESFVPVMNDDVSNNKDFNRTIESIIDIDQDIIPSGVINESVTTQFGFVQDIETTDEPLSRHVEHTLTITQDVPQPLGAINKTVESIVTISHVFTAVHNGTGGPVGACIRRDLLYHPEVESETSFPAKPTLVPQGQLLLEYPPGAPTSTATLPQPLLGNRETLEKTRIQRKSRAGKLITFNDANWPDTVTYRFQFQDLTDAEKDDLFSFVALTLAQQVRLTDHEGRVWDGVIVNPNGEYTQIFRDCGKTAEFDFIVAQ